MLTHEKIISGTLLIIYSDSAILLLLLFQSTPSILNPCILKLSLSIYCPLYNSAFRSSSSKDYFSYWATIYLVAVMKASGNIMPPIQIPCSLKLSFEIIKFSYFSRREKSMIHSFTVSFMTWYFFQLSGTSSLKISLASFFI